MPRPNYKTVTYAELKEEIEIFFAGQGLVTYDKIRNAISKINGFFAISQGNFSILSGIESTMEYVNACQDKGIFPFDCCKSMSIIRSNGYQPLLNLIFDPINN